MKTSTEFSLSKQDSVRFDYLADLNLMDVNSDGDRLLLYSYLKKSFLIIDTSGKLLSTFELDPNVLGRLPFLSSQFVSNGFAIGTDKGFFIMDFNGDVIQEFQFDRNFVPSLARFSSENPLISHEEKFYFSYPQSNLEIGINSPQFYQNSKLIGVYDKKSKKVDLSAPLPQNSVYKNGKSHQLDDFDAIIRLKDSIFFVALKKELAIFKYDLANLNGEPRRISLKIDGFYVNEGIPMDLVNPDMLMFDPTYGSIENFYNFNDEFIVFYKKGYEEADRQKFDLLNSPVELEEFQEIAKNKYPYFVGYFDNQGNLLKELELSSDFNPNNTIFSGDYLYSISNPSTISEEDFYTINIYNLTKK
ncbi:hypothetical protein [Algoriphagus terrigena]|uniref:hypothetical protein n=1 Tax=Algoriphagus terrigena TaxID=344884 RepID=UPI00146FA59B|nr:hypothetical protein [Algoriphagus terrigena]